MRETTPENDRSRRLLAGTLARDMQQCLRSNRILHWVGVVVLTGQGLALALFLSLDQWAAAGATLFFSLLMVRSMAASRRQYHLCRQALFHAQRFLAADAEKDHHFDAIAQVLGQVR